MFNSLSYFNKLEQVTPAYEHLCLLFCVSDTLTSLFSLLFQTLIIFSCYVCFPPICLIFFTCYLCFRCTQPIIKNRNGIVYEIKYTFSCLRIKPLLLSDEFVLWGKKYVSTVILLYSFFYVFEARTETLNCNHFVISCIE